MKDPLFNPIRINRLEIKNRICMPAMHLNMTSNYEITDQLVDFYVERAKGGAGLIVIGFATVDELSGGPTGIGAHKDEFIPGLRRMARALRENGAAAAVQLNHAGKNVRSNDCGGVVPVAPSAIFSKKAGETPRALEKEEILRIIDRFAQAALRVKSAGYDAVEILCSTGYLISSFLSPLTNQRTDEWGGSLENRMRFGLEIIKSVKKTVGNDYPVIARLNGNDLMPGGVGRKGHQEFAERLAEAGADALNINVGWHEAMVPQIITCVPRGTFAYFSKIIKSRVKVPVISSHRIHNAQTARELLENHMCDMVAFGRPLIADPYMPQKVHSGRENEVIHCIACSQGCFDHVGQAKFVECLCNPRAGKERAAAFEGGDTPKKVMIIGGGPAGMSAALAARERGHSVSLYEKKAQLGGQLFLAATPPGREEFAELARDMAEQLKINHIQVNLSKVVNKAILEKVKPDFVVLATGAKPLTPRILGVDFPHVVQAWDVLAGKVKTGKRVVIIGGGAVGVETALFLAEKGTLSGEVIKFLLVNRAEPFGDLYELATKGTKKVVLLEMTDKLGRDFGRTTRWAMIQDLSRRGVEMRTRTKALEIVEAGVKVEAANGNEEIPADTIVLAVGSISENALQPLLENMGIPFEIVGDAGRIGLAFDAVHHGFEVGRRI